MAEITVQADNFILISSWRCVVVYFYNSNGSFQRVYSRTQYDPSTGTNTVSFPVDIPASAKIKSAKVHAIYTASWGSGTFLINGTTPDENGFVTLTDPDWSTGSINVEFSYTADKDSLYNHDGGYPTYNGSSTRSRTFYHSSEPEVSEIYLQLEYQTGSVIYHAENGILVPYQLFYAENGELVPYQLQHGENDVLVPYG